MPHISHGVWSPSLQPVTNPTCSVTGVFLVVSSWKTLTEKIGSIAVFATPFLHSSQFLIKMMYLNTP